MPLRPAALMALVALASLLATQASAAGDAEEGRRVARQWCSSCHIVGPGMRGGDAAPPFQALADDPTKTEHYLKTWISNPHPPMPNFNLTRRTVDDLTAYIRSLSSGKPGAVRKR